MPEAQVVWQVQNVPLTLAFIGTLFGVYYLVAWYAKQATRTVGDLWVAGRAIGAPMNAMAMTATWISLACMLGVIGLILKFQIPFVFLWIQWIVSIPLIVLLYGTQLRRLGSYTPASFIRDRYGKTASVIAAFIMIFILLMYGVGNIIGTAKILEILLGLPYQPALVLGSLVVVGYVALGGMYGLSYNDALQMLVMLVTWVVPLMAIMKALGSSGWWFPQLGYGDMTEAMLRVFPTYFEMQFPLKWYVSILIGFTLGAMGLPHLAIRVFTAPTLRSARKAVVWFTFFCGMFFSACFAMGFAGVYHFTKLGVDFPMREADKTAILLNLAYNPDWVTAFLIAGIVAAGISSIASHLIGIAALTANDILAILWPTLTEPKRLRVGYLAILGAGVASILVALNPPSFLVITIFWGFGLSATCITPQLVLGTWSSRVNRYGAILSMLVSGFVYVLVSPYAFPGIVLGSGLASQMGLSGALVSAPLGFFLTIAGSLVAERVPALAGRIPLERTKRLVERIHGWPGYTGRRYAGVGWLVVIATLSVPLLIWGLMPWPR